MSFDEQTREDLMRLLRRGGFYFGIFLAGGLMTFAYSYRPLHGAKNWKIDYLEEQLEHARIQLGQLDRELANSQTAHLNQPNAEAFKAVQNQLAETDASIAKLEKELKSSKKKLKELESARNTWKSRYSKAEAERKQLAASIEAQSAPAASGSGAVATRESADGAGDRVGEESESAPTPASPAADFDPDSASRGGIIAEGVTIALGKSWTSGDGRARFDVAAVERELAKVVTELPGAAPGAAPDVISVRSGDRFRIGSSTDAPLEIVVVRIEAPNSITVDILEVPSEPS